MDPCSYVWEDVNDPNGSGETWLLGEGEVMEFTFEGAVEPHVRLTVTDGDGRSDAAVQELVVVEDDGTSDGGTDDGSSDGDSGDGSDDGSAGEGSATEAVSSVNQHGITVSLDGDYEVGRFVNGD